MTINDKKQGGNRSNSGRKPGFVGYWKGKKRPNAFGGKRRVTYGKDNIFSKIIFSGEKHHLWKGGGWLYWKKQTFVRDNYTCQICKLYDPEVMIVDHIIPKKKTGEKYTDTQHNINNLQTLCANCHLKKSRSERRDGARGKSYYSII